MGRLILKVIVNHTREGLRSSYPHRAEYINRRGKLSPAPPCVLTGCRLSPLRLADGVVSLRVRRRVRVCDLVVSGRTFDRMTQDLPLI